MVQIPIRKCYFLAKLCILLVLVITLLGLFEQWRGGKRTATAMYSDPMEEEYERQILEDEARIVPGLGDLGEAAFLSGDEKAKGEESEKKYAMNTYLSDRIAYNRTLKDFRNSACARVTYDAELPSASIILIFHNEPYSVVVRTIWSVLNSARRDNHWYRQANFHDSETNRLMTLGYPGQDPNSPFVYLKEIILVDDNSTLPELRGKLSHYIRTRLPPDLIKILRLPDRQGLMRARSTGARAARGDVLIFLDAHCEPGSDWLRPLLQRLEHKRDAVVTPVIDVIDQTSFKLDAAEFFQWRGYGVSGPLVSFDVVPGWTTHLYSRRQVYGVVIYLTSTVQIGGFTFMGHFTWIDIPEREKKRRGSDIAPTWSPTMAGGLFAIRRSYYWELGAYDEQMAGWGGENLEISFRIWQCGGTLETIPCSRVGHVFRAFHPYGLPSDSDTHGINTARMAEVWMDEYAELFYLHRPDLRKSPKIGDVTHRKILREKLHCKNFKWYLDNIYKEKFVPIRDVSGFGRFENTPSGLCLDTLQREGEATNLGLYPCLQTLAATQTFSLSLTGQLRDEERCADLQHSRYHSTDLSDAQSRPVIMVSCHEKNRGQQWRFLPGTQQVQHAASGLCLDAGGARSGGDVSARSCRGRPSQRWRIDYIDDEWTSNVLSEDQVENIEKLRGQRRKSRSLMSYEEGSEAPETEHHEGQDAVHTRSKSKKISTGRRNITNAAASIPQRSHKNKFILKLERTLMNDSLDHLEVDIHCSHRRLYPNNTFVRDLVTILNENNIRVINNGRVFERNRVVELVKTEIPTEPPTTTEIEPKTTIQEMVKKSHRHRGHKKRVKTDTKVSSTALPTTAGKPNRIIIEDFVEIKPLSPTVTTLTKSSKHSKKRKRKRSTTVPPQEPVDALDTPLFDLRTGNKLTRTPDSIEEAFKPDHQGSDESPMVMSKRDGTGLVDELEQDDDSEDGYWTGGDFVLTGKLNKSTFHLPRTHHTRFDVNPLLGDDGEKALQGARDKDESKPTRLPSSVEEERRHAGGESDKDSKRLLSAGERDSSAEKSSDVDAKVKVVTEEAVTSQPAADDSGSVKLVMRSNLTFNLGDELFSWKRRTPNFADVLEELSIPSNVSAAVRARSSERDRSSASSSSSSEE